MARPVGLSKTGGRIKGTPNKSTQNLVEVLDSLEFSIPDRLLKLMPSLSPEKQADVLMGLLRYIYPTRKAVEHSGEVLQKPENSWRDYENKTSAQIEEELKETMAITFNKKIFSLR
jgi:hypothetical protein